LAKVWRVANLGMGKAGHEQNWVYLISSPTTFGDNIGGAFKLN